LVISAILFSVDPSIEKVLHLSEARLARSLDSAVEFHRNGEMLLCLTALDKATQLLDPQKAAAKKFLEAWKIAVEREVRGLPLPVAPKAWGEIALMISARAGRSESYEDCLHSLTAVRGKKRELLRRALIVALGIFTFIAGLTAIMFVLRGILTHFDQSYRIAQLAFFRHGIWLAVHALATFVSGMALAFFGFRWIKAALNSGSLIAPKFKLTTIEPKDELNR
jgi:hypothetical protein